MNLHLKKLQREIQNTMAGISPDQWTHHPPGKWSPTEVLEHLYLTYTGTLKGFSRVIEAGQPKVTRPTFRQRVGRLAVLRFGHLPSGREAPAFARPKGIAEHTVRQEILDKINAMDEMIAQCEQKFGSGVLLLDHVILGPLTGDQWRTFHLVHGRHHLKQIRSAVASGY